jgi:hypothetical protein
MKTKRGSWWQDFYGCQCSFVMLQPSSKKVHCPRHGGSTKTFQRLEAPVRLGFDAR